MTNSIINSDEDITDLFWNNYKLLQKKQGFRFSSPSVLLAHFLNVKDNSNIIELGCGSGVISILLHAKNPSINITAVEIQTSQAQIAQRNFSLNNISAQVLCTDLRNLTNYGKYNLVVTNPPFFPLGSGVVNPTDEKALARHEISCTLEDIISQSAKLLDHYGTFAMVHIPKRLDEIMNLCLKYKLYPKRIQFVHSKLNQDAHFVIIEAVKNRKYELKIVPPVIIYNADGSFFEEYQNIITGGLQ